MSLPEFAEILGKIAGSLPPEDMAKAIFDRNKGMGSPVLLEVLKSKMTGIPGSGPYLKLVKSTISDLNDKDVIDDIIYFFDEYYPGLVNQISESPEETRLTLEVLEGLLKVVRDAN